MIIALNDRVVIEKIKDEKVTKSGIMLPGEDKDKLVLKGKVIHVGSNVKSIEKDNIVLCNKHTVIDIVDTDDIVYGIVKEENIYCKLK